MVKDQTPSGKTKPMVRIHPETQFHNHSKEQYHERRRNAEIFNTHG